MPRDNVAVSFLGVERSLTGRRWVGPTAEAERLAEAMAQDTALPDPICRTLVRRNVAPGAAAAFLAPSLRELLPDPMSLRDMGSATERFLQAVSRRERIAIFADYDVDGGASAALILTWLRAQGPRRDALHSRPDRRGLRAERTGDGGAGARSRPDHLRRLRHAEPRADRRRRGGRRDRARPPSRRDHAARRGGRGEPQPPGRGRRPRASLRGRRGVPDAGRGEPAAARPRVWRGRT